MTPQQLEILDDRFGARQFADVFGYEPGWGVPSDRDASSITEAMVELRTRQRS